MKTILLFAVITGGLVSFNSHAVSCQADLKINRGMYKPYYEVKKPDVLSDKYINLDGYEYLAVDGVLTTHEGSVIADSFVSTGKPVSGDVPPSVVSNGDSSEPDMPSPDVKPPVTDVKQPVPDKSKPAGSYVSDKLDFILKSDPNVLYTSFRIRYDYSDTSYNNLMLAKAFLQKLSNVTPPDYSSVENIKSMMDSWYTAHLHMTKSGAGTRSFYHWYNSRFVSGEHRYLGEILLAVNSCPEFKTFGSCNDQTKALHINDPYYASFSDYKIRVTRCDRNPADPSCRSSGGGGGLFPDPDDSGSGDSGSGGGSTDTVDKPNNDNSGTDNNDNSDVVSAINRFRDANNLKHLQLVNQLTNDNELTNNLLASMIKNDDYSDTTNKVGDLFNNGVSDFKSGAESAINSLIDSLESYAPALKGFGLPDGFYSGNRRCVTLDMSFTVSLPFYDYSAPVNLSTDKLCKFYDGYPRELLRMLIYMLTVFVLIVLLKQSLK